MSKKAWKMSKAQLYGMKAKLSSKYNGKDCKGSGNKISVEKSR